MFAKAVCIPRAINFFFVLFDNTFSIDYTLCFTAPECCYKIT